ncbi:MAG: nucleotidyltransferase domain-containing protein [Deltaproteobacteria bacterium]|nr:nucleotidyltransferase domain-containing protein [Deltaproteobacteria bacterium]
MLGEVFEEVLQAVREACLREYGARLQSLAVFGSVARGTVRADSDIDLLIVADPLPDGRMARVAEFEAIERLVCGALAKAREQGVATTLSPVFKTPSELEAGSLLFLDMTDQARLLVDRHGILRRYLDGLSRRMAALGSRRVACRGGYYWLLKPDLKPGEEIRL